jgi:DNA-binding MarR family transcriptional regulator
LINDRVAFDLLLGQGPLTRTELRALTGLSRPTVSDLVERLRADGLIEVDREEIVDNRLRRYYRLLPAGEKRLAEEAARLHSHATAALRRLNLNLAGGAA